MAFSNGYNDMVLQQRFESDFRGTNVTQRQLDDACGSGTKLPAGLRIQPCPASNPAIEVSSEARRQ